MDTLRKSSSDTTDIIGAAKYLPSQEDFGEFAGNSVEDETQIVSPVVISKVKVPKTVKSGEDGESLEFSSGDVAEDGVEGDLPHDTNTPPNPNSYPNPEPNLDDGVKIGEGDKPVLKKATLSGMRYRSIVRNKNEGLYTCTFTSLYNESNCDFQIRMCGESEDKYSVPIVEASVNGNKCDILNGCVVGLVLKKGEHYTISYTVDKHELFASEVIVNAYR